MKQKKIVLGILLALVLLLGAAYLLYVKLGSSIAPNQLSAQGAPDSAGGAPGASSQQPQPVPAPDFTVYDGDGNAVHLSDYVGKPVVMNFWASWCGHVRWKCRIFRQSTRELGGEVQFLMINMTGGRGKRWTAPKSSLRSRAIRSRCSTIQIPTPPSPMARTPCRRPTLLTRRATRSRRPPARSTGRSCKPGST